MSRPTSPVALYQSEWWNRLAAISEKGMREKPVARIETRENRPSFLIALSSMFDSLVGKRLITSIVKMH